ncbi:hypothetical protein [Nocardioides ferulae]|uniref:hypothetical protein n=1 Tax=Nocardioides ferulae TaxID=2340821 RepID=UPI000EB1F6E4|nr:hypothetical protein [Nocardioides ferulae]
MRGGGPAGALALVMALLLTACTGDRARGESDGGRATGLASDSEASPPTRVSLAGQRPAAWPRLPAADASGLPWRLPETGADLPSLLDDLPGRATVVVNPRIEAINIAVTRWSELELLVAGAEGGWRRLNLGDLGLPEAQRYSDTYGAGQLSPDGRRWAGPVRDGVVVLDLRTGAARIVRLRSPGAFVWVPGRGPVPAAAAPEPEQSPSVRSDRDGLRVIDAGETVGELTWGSDRFPLHEEIWLDDETLLIATRPWFLVWRPATGEVLRVTDARALDPAAYWQISLATATAGRRAR